MAWRMAGRIRSASARSLASVGAVSALTRAWSTRRRSPSTPMMVASTIVSPPPRPRSWLSWLASRARRIWAPRRSRLVGSSSISTLSSSVSRWTLTRAPVTYDCWPKIAVVRLMLT
jgi:hypothetical protein